jgi:hypothetical protein
MMVRSNARVMVSLQALQTNLDDADHKGWQPQKKIESVSSKNSILSVIDPGTGFSRRGAAGTGSRVS